MDMSGKPARSRVGMFSRASAVRNVDGRTVEARIVKSTIADLTDQLGGDPTAAQQLLIHGTAVLVLRLRVALDRYTSGIGDVESLDRHVVSLQNSLRHNLQAIGLARVEQAPPSLADILAPPRGRKAA